MTVISERIETIGAPTILKVSPTRAAARARGRQLAEIRQAAGYRQVEIAAAMGISQARISKIENGEIAAIDVIAAYIAAVGGTVEFTATVYGQVWKMS
jgi:DNA-binding XRE family transcriptional regulator